MMGGKESALHAIWHLTQQRKLKPRYWPRLLRLRANFDLDFLQYKDMHIAIPKGKIPDCPNCLETCCSGPNAVVSLRLIDIAKLVDNGFAKNIVPATKTAHKSGTTFSETLFAQSFPTLKRDATNTCTLYNTQRLCSAFPNWPLSCARYPYAVDAKNRVIFFAKGCRSYELVPAHTALPQSARLYRAAMDSYNERIKDLFMLALSLPELKDAGLVEFLDTSALAQHMSWI